MSPEPTHSRQGTGGRRWRLHRGGVVNIWQYAEQEFDFSGGRVIFQGTNGSGKSRTLELLFPLCLDGELRYLGSKGAGTVSIRRLMLDDYDAGPNRVGYTWVELVRSTGSGEEYLTCGLGLKASKSSQQITDSWRFITPARVGKQFRLVGADEVPLGRIHLRDEIGADCLYEEAAFRAKIAETVYGMPAGRYGDLLHLQRTLRNPDVGLKVLDGQLEQILSDALPPLDPGMVEHIATSFDDLESIRENITRLSDADQALGKFLSTYSDYALRGLRAAAEQWESAEGGVRARQRETRTLAGQLAEAQRKRAAADERHAELEAQEQTTDEKINGLKQAPAYRDLQDLRGQEAVVAAERSAASTALEAAARQRAQEDAAAEGVLRLHRRLTQDLAAAEADCAEPLRRRLVQAGLDATLCPDLPVVPDAEAEVAEDRVRVGPDPEADPVTVRRVIPPRLDGEELGKALDLAAEAAADAVAVVRQRAALVLNLHQQASDLDAQQQRLDGQRRSAQDAQQAATDAAARRDTAAKDLATAAQDWLHRVSQWCTSTDSTVDISLPTVDELAADPALARALSTQARQAIAPLLHQAREQAHGLARRRVEIQERIDAHQAELASLRSGGEREPEIPGHATQPRDPATGAPFYRLVDFHPDLTTVQRADLEAALQASGLLNAWVSATGQVRADARGEVFATAHGPALATGGLAEVLVPATDPDSPVPADVVTALLARISATDNTDHSGLMVLPTGHWRAGALAGVWSKPAAEFIGAGAREAARRQRISLLDEELRALRGELAAAGTELAEARDQVSTWERRIEEFPGDGELIVRHGRLQATEEAADQALHQALALREHAEAAQGRWEAARGELARHAGEAGLSSPTTETLRQARQATQDAQHSAERLAEALRRQCRNTLNDLITAGHTHQAAVADRIAAEREAEAKCRSYVAGAARLAELSKAVGGEAKQVAENLRELEQGRGRLRDELKQVRERVADLREQAAKLDALLGTARDALAGAEANHERAKEAFHQVATAPGIVAAAFPALETLPDPDDLPAVRAAIAEAGNRRGAVESNVLAKLQALQTSLSGSHDITAEHHAGLLTVTVTGEEGPRPVAVAARQVSAKLAEQRGFLDERYQDIFADYLIRDVAESLREQIAVAEDLSRRMNEVLARARSSQGVHVKLSWKTSAALDEDTRQALELVRMPFGNRTPEQDALLRRMFTERIELERGSASGGYAEILARALDYRSWYEFKVTVADTGPDGRSRERRLRQLSSGETRLVSYVTLFAAAASFYDAVGDSAAGFDPLRLVLLDEAFERLDDPTIQRMLGLLVDLDMDWVITWPSGWGVSEKIPRMHIYDVLRPRAGGGVACTQTTWDGAGLDRVDP